MQAPPEAARQPTFGSAFWGLFGARTVSSLGDGLSLVAFPILATRLTHNPMLIAGVAVAGGLPWFLVALPAGALADRMDRRRLIAATELTRMAVLVAVGALVLTGNTTIVALYAASFLLGSCESAFAAATQAVLPDIVDRTNLARANGRLMTSESACAQFVGPAIAGGLFAAGAALPFLADGLSFALSGLLLLLALPRRRTARLALTTTARPTVRQDVAEGLRWFAGHPVLRLSGGLVSTFAFCQALGMAILVLFAQHVLHLSGTGFGLFIAGAAIGNVIGGMVAARMLARLGAGRVFVLAGLLAAGGFLLVAGTSSVAVALVGLGIEAVAVGVGNVASVTVRQSLIPSDLAGRVNAAMRTCTFGAWALGALAGGILVTVGGTRLPFAVGGSLQAVMALVIGIPLARLLAAEARVIDVAAAEDLIAAAPAFEALPADVA